VPRHTPDAPPSGATASSAPSAVGDHEVAHLVGGTESYCAACLAEQDRLVSFHWWEDDKRDQIRFRGTLVAA
jgi:hypothetical protein